MPIVHCEVIEKDEQNEGILRSLNVVVISSDDNSDDKKITDGFRFAPLLSSASTAGDEKLDIEKVGCANKKVADDDSAGLGDR